MQRPLTLGRKRVSMRPRMVLRPRQRSAMRSRLFLSGAFILVTTISTIIYFQFGHVQNVQAAASYYTISDGEWSSLIWSTSSNAGTSCSCNPGCKYNGPGIYITNKVTNTVCSPLKYSGCGVINVSGSGRLLIYTDFEINGGSTLNIANGDTVVVYGNLTISGGSQVNSSGYFYVNGNVTMSGGSNVCGSGFANYSGTLTGTTWCSGVLPIELLYLNVKSNTGYVNCSWATATETNNDYFTIERSQDGKTFEEILRKPGAGNSVTQREYSIIDEAPMKGINYYRLKQTDYDGTFSYSQVKSVLFKAENTVEVISINSVSPNPFEDNFSITYSVQDNAEVGVSIINTLGKKVFNQKQNAVKGINRFDFKDALNLPTGIYFAELTMNNHLQIQKLVKN